MGAFLFGWRSGSREQFGGQHTHSSSFEIGNCLFPPFGFCGVIQFHIILLNNLGGGAVVRGIPVVSIFVDGILQ